MVPRLLGRLALPAGAISIRAVCRCILFRRVLLFLCRDPARLVHSSGHPKPRQNPPLKQEPDDDHPQDPKHVHSASFRVVHAVMFRQLFPHSTRWDLLSDPHAAKPVTVSRTAVQNAHPPPPPPQFPREAMGLLPLERLVATETAEGIFFRTVPHRSHLTSSVSNTNRNNSTSVSHFSQR